MDNYYDYLKEKAYFVRKLFWDDDENYMTPIFIKVPESILEPSRDIKLLIKAIEELFEVECFVVFFEIKETSRGPQIVQYGPDADVDAVLLVTTWVGEDEVISGVITPEEGEYELLCLRPDGSRIVPEVDADVVEALGLEYTSNMTDVYRAWWASQGYKESAGDNVYYPNFIYD
ncbi:hypothetical protein IKG73_02615 [Candidatus Saccharibacteria bacterium]|nr:hypothetical protein [Candidatus Saccharibacteria bacterium]